MNQPTLVWLVPASEGQGRPHPSHPIAIPPSSEGGTPPHPWLPPALGGSGEPPPHPWLPPVLGDGGISGGGTPTHPINQAPGESSMWANVYIPGTGWVWAIV